jgi:hypothetical protein
MTKSGDIIMDVNICHSNIFTLPEDEYFMFYSSKGNITYKIKKIG